MGYAEDVSDATIIETVGKLEFVVEHRDAKTVAGDPDGGTSLHVYTEIDGRHQEVLRFDCFRVEPHFHYLPENQQWFLDPLTTGDTIEWTRHQVQTRLPEMIAKAGFDALSKSVDREMVNSILPRLEKAMRTGKKA